MKTSKNPAVVVRIDKRQLATKIKDQTGMTQREADNAIAAFTLVTSTWIESMIRDIPEGAQAWLSIQGFGKIIVSFRRKGRISTWRTLHGIPQRPALIYVDFKPSRKLHNLANKVNNPIRESYLKDYRPARDSWENIFIKAKSEAFRRKPAANQTG